MKKSLTSLIFLICALFTSQNLGAQDFLTGKGEIYIFPENPGPMDSVFLNYTYISTDGCPDYTLYVDSIAPGKIHVKLDNIMDSTRICTMVISKFRLTVNLGTISQATDIYLNKVLIRTIPPACIPDRIGKVVAYTENASLIEEDSTKLIFQLPGYTLKMGTIVKFSGTEIQCIKAPCYNIINCFRFAEVPIPPCEQNRKGIVIQGKEECSGRLFIQEYSPISSSLQLWDMAVVTADAYYKPGDQVIFGGFRIAPDSTQSFYCHVVGRATCIKKIQNPLEVVEVSGIAMADSVVVQSGYAVLFSKESRKALASTFILDGKFHFRGIKNHAYTVFVVPDKRMYPGYLPTFYKDKQAWKMADFILLTDSTQSIQIELLKYVLPEGRGKIYGRIHYEDGILKDSTLIANGTYTENKLTTDSSACNIPVILYNNLQKAVSWTLTDANGNYSFDKIAAGTYTVVAETPVASAITNVVLADETTAEDVNLLLKSTESSTKTENPEMNLLKIYPNPVGDICFINAPTSGALNIFSISGQLIKMRLLHQGSNEINVTELKSGFYIAKFGNDVFKLKKE